MLCCSDKICREGDVHSSVNISPGLWLIQKKKANILENYYHSQIALVVRRPKNNVIKENVSCVLQKSPQGQKFSLPSAAGQEIDLVMQYNSGCAVFKYSPTLVWLKVLVIVKSSLLPGSSLSKDSFLLMLYK